MSYIDIAITEDGNNVTVWEKNNEGNIQRKRYDAEYYYYVANTQGTTRSIFPDKFSHVKRMDYANRNELKDAVEDHYEMYRRRDQVPPPLFESDIPPDLRALSDFYYKAPIPNLNVCFFDIETDADLEKYGWATIDNPYGDVISIALYHQWKNEIVVIATPPPGYDGPLYTAEELECDRIIYTANEKELLDLFLKEIEDADVLSGWNSDKYDIPYLIERYKKAYDDLSKNEVLSLMCRDGVPAKKKEIPAKFGKGTEIIYRLYGRINIDYMDLYKKFTFEELQSYSLESVSDHELGYGKVEYKGTLPKLYRKDFKTFLEYNRHDSVLLRDLDAKMNFMSLMNLMAHQCCCRLQDVLGTVVMTDQALMAWAHHERGQVIPDKGTSLGIPEYVSTVAREYSSSDKYAGAFVYDMDEYDEHLNIIATKRGLADYVGSVDITSLYPNAIISNNVSIETVTWHASKENGDVLWADKMNYYRDKIHRYEKKQQDYDIITNSDKKGIKLQRTRVLLDAEKNSDFSRVEELESYKWGARNDIVGIVPEILIHWFNQRLEMKGKMKDAIKKRTTVLEKHGVDVKAKLDDIKKLLPEDAFSEYLQHKTDVETYDRLQHIKKIQLNSLYGATGNKHSHFYNVACAEACTLAGQGITHHMIKSVAYLLDGSEDIRSKSIQYADTDSCYFRILDAENDEDAIAIGNAIGSAVNGMFFDYMKETHNCNDEQAARIAADREVISDKSLFVGKKYYAMHVIDNEGQKVDKLKIMGMSAIKSDTPVVIKKMLKTVLVMILRDKKSEDEVARYINEFRDEFHTKLHPLDFGFPKGVKGIEDYLDRLEVRAIYDKESRGGDMLFGDEGISPKEEKRLLKAQEDPERWAKITKGKVCFVPGHVRACINWNQTLDDMGDKISPRIVSGTKIKTFYLKKNSKGFTSIAVPTDIHEIPEWFLRLPIDMNKMEETLIDKKLDTFYKPINWDIPKNTGDDSFIF